MRRLAPFLLIVARVFGQCSGYGSSQIVDINRLQVPTTQVNYTVLVSGLWSFLADTSHGGSVTSGKGYDICFSDSGNASRYHWEIERYDNTSGSASFWVLPPAVNGANASSDTQFKIWYGNSSVTTFQGGALGSNWDANYKGVWHLADTAQLTDSTSNGNNLTNNGATNGTGKVGGGASFTTGKNVTRAGGAAGFAQFPATIDVWFNVASIQARGSQIWDNTPILGFDDSYWSLQIDGITHKLQYYYYGSSGQAWLGTTAISTGTWYHLVVVSSSTGSQMFLNGVSEGSSTLTLFNNIGGVGQSFKVGDWNNGTDHPFAGSQDELRISNIARSPDWIATEYHNISSPGTFLTISGGLPPTVSSFTATPAAIGLGETSTLAWTTSGADLVSIVPGAFTSTGASGSTPVNPASATTYTLTATNGGGSTQAQATVTVGAPAPPIVGGMSCSANSPSSILCSWTTNTPATSQVQCGTQSGGPYTYATTVLHPVQVGTSAWWGVTSHSIAITGLVNNTSPTAYYCVAVSVNQFGLTATSAEMTSGTLAPLASTPITIADVSPPTRVNDQYNGANGMPNNGTWIDGDTQYSTWADDGFTYGMYQDGFGVKGAAGASLGYVKWDAAHLVPTQIAAIGVGLGGNPYSEQGPLSARGAQYHFAINGYGNQACCFNVIKTPDHWATSISPQRDAGPNTGSVSGIDVSPVLAATIGGHSFASGTLTLTVSTWSVTPPAVSEVYISGSTNCDGFHWTTATSSTTVNYAAGGDAACTAGTVQYMQSMNQPVKLPGDTGIYWLISPIQPCQDYSINCTSYANMDGWVYLFAEYRGLVRVRIEDLPLQDMSKYQCYAGSQNGDDGLYDANWVQATSGACKALTAAPGDFDPYAYMPFSGDKGHIAYIPDFNRFVLSVYLGPNNCASGSGIYDLGPYPWGKPVRMGAINRDLRFPGLCPGFPNPVLATYQKVSSNPLTATMTWVTSGGSFKGPRNAGDTDNYSAFLWHVRLVPRIATAGRPLASRNGGGGRHIANGLRLFYNFQDVTGSLQVVNRSPNDPTGAYSYVASNGGSPPINDGYGLVLGAPGGPDNFTDGISWVGQQQNTNIMTPYSAALNSYTAFVCFGHYPYQFNGTTINNGHVGEQVLAKSGGDLVITRHGATYGAGASWDVMVHGTVVGSVAIPDGTFGCVAVRVNGASAAVYLSSALAAGLPPTPTAGPATVSSAGSAGNLILGGATSLWGSLSELLIYDRALSDAELIQEARITQKDMAQRGIGTRGQLSGCLSPIDPQKINHILVSGQSLARGEFGTPVLTTSQPSNYNNYTLSGTDELGTAFGPLVGNTWQANGDYVQAPSFSAGAELTYLTNGGFTSAITIHGLGGIAYSGLQRTPSAPSLPITGTVAYQNGITQIQNAMAAAAGLGRPYKVSGLLFTHGESDMIGNMSAAQYEADLVQMQADYQFDAKRIAGQADPVPMFLDQMAGLYADPLRAHSGNTLFDSVVRAQWNVARDHPTTHYLVAPKYQFPYNANDHVHLTNIGYVVLGELQGKAMKKVLVENTPWVPLAPRSITQTGSSIAVQFWVPEGQITIDTTTLPPVAPNTSGNAPNTCGIASCYGFEVFCASNPATACLDAGSNPIAIVGVAVTSADTITLTLSGTPVQTPQIFCGMNSPMGIPGTASSPHTNIRDTATTVGVYSGQVLYDWSILWAESAGFNWNPYCSINCGCGLQAQ